MAVCSRASETGAPGAATPCSPMISGAFPTGFATAGPVSVGIPEAGSGPVNGAVTPWPEAAAPAPVISVTGAGAGRFDTPMTGMAGSSFRRSIAAAAVFDGRGAPGRAGWGISWGVAAKRAAGTLGIVMARLATPDTTGPMAAAAAIPGAPLIPGAVPAEIAAGEDASIGVPGAGNGPAGEPVALGPRAAAQGMDWTAAGSTGPGGALLNAAGPGIAATVVGRSEPTSGLAVAGVGIVEVTSGLAAACVGIGEVTSRLAATPSMAGPNCGGIASAGSLAPAATSFSPTGGVAFVPTGLTPGFDATALAGMAPPPTSEAVTGRLLLIGEPVATESTIPTSPAAAAGTTGGSGTMVPTARVDAGAGAAAGLPTLSMRIRGVPL